MDHIAELTKLFEDEVKTNIMFLIDMFGPLNLETMHELLNKPKSTLFGHLREMLAQNQIELDSIMTAEKTGKYYRLTEYVSSLLNDTDNEITLKKDTLKDSNIDKEDFVRMVANIQRVIGFQANLLSYLSAQYLERNINLFDDVSKHKKELLGFYASIYELRINSSEEMEEIRNILKDMNEKLKKFDRKHVDKYKRTLLMFLIASPKDRIGPKNL
ncbi:MAG: hypothetical protein JW776_11530 [Candidatus Lokiarchaeota archaeon]|nr:hypothetical protein [Candidatus Lokiarchaeota archaeon]